MSTHPTAGSLRVVPAHDSPLELVTLGTPSTTSAPGAHGLNTLRAVADYGPSEMAELDGDVAGLIDKLQKLQFRRQYLVRLLTVAQEYDELR